MTAMIGPSSVESSWSSYASIYMTALTTSRKQRTSRQDLFGNVRIPSLDSLMSPLVMENGSWSIIDYNWEIPYSFMLGIPVVGVPMTGNLSFNLVSRYLAIDCDSAIHVANSTVFANSSSELGAGFSTSMQGANFIIQPGDRPSPALANDTIASFNMSSGNG